MNSKQDIVRMWKDQSIITDEQIVQAFLDVPREYFVDQEYAEHAYADSPLPIMCGKTISQPTTIALMTQALELKRGHRVLEIGTGSGYQAALLSDIVGPAGRVFSTEVVPELVSFARENLAKIGLQNITVHEEDGSQGLVREAPFDRIIITAACPGQVPPPLLDQLKDGGILVAPVGDIGMQEVLKMRKLPGGLFQSTSLGEFRFLPLVGKHGFSDEQVG